MEGNNNATSTSCLDTCTHPRCQHTQCQAPPQPLAFTTAAAAKLQDEHMPWSANHRQQLQCWPRCLAKGDGQQPLCTHLSNQQHLSYPTTVAHTGHIITMAPRTGLSAPHTVQGTARPPAVLPTQLHNGCDASSGGAGHRLGQKPASQHCQLLPQFTWLWAPPSAP